MKKKNGFHEPGNQLFTRKNQTFFENNFLLIPTVVSNCSKIATHPHNNTVSTSQKSVCTSPMKHIENTFPLYKKLLSFRKYLKKSKKLVEEPYSLSGIWFFFKN